MQTFLPCPEFAKSAAALDDKRLGKQRVECLQILKALTEPSYGWQHHPATKMWRGHRVALASYGMTVCDEWMKRGFNDTCKAKIEPFLWCGEAGTDPTWNSNPALHSSHRAALLFKNPQHYGQFGWGESPAVPNEKGSLPYFWPV